MTSFKPSRSRSAMVTFEICGRSSPFGGLPIGRAVRSAVVRVDVAAVVGVVAAGAGSPPPPAMRPTAAAIVRNRRTKDQELRTDLGPHTDQERRTKDKGLYEHSRARSSWAWAEPARSAV